MFKTICLSCLLFSCNFINCALISCTQPNEKPLETATQNPLVAQIEPITSFKGAEVTVLIPEIAATQPTPENKIKVVQTQPPSTHEKKKRRQKLEGNVGRRATDYSSDSDCCPKCSDICAEGGKAGVRAVGTQCLIHFLVGLMHNHH